MSYQMLDFLLLREDFEPHIALEVDLDLRDFVEVVPHMLPCVELDFFLLPEGLEPNKESTDLFLPFVVLEPNKAAYVEDFFFDGLLDPNSASNLELLADLCFLSLAGTNPSGVDSNLFTTYFEPICLFLFFCNFDSGELPVLVSMYLISFFPVSQFLLFALKS